MADPDSTAQARRQYNAYALDYDQETGWYEKVMLADGRAWACHRAWGAVLDVAVGTGRNLSFYPANTHVIGLDLSEGMLTLARRQIRELELKVDLVQGDAQAMPFADCTFDTIVCTLGLSSIPDDEAAVTEMYRVLRSAGQLVLLGHVASPHRPVRAVQRMIDRAAAKNQRPADAQTRTVLPLLRGAGFTVGYHRESRAGIIQRIIATKP